MTLVTKGSRAITVDDLSLRWWARRRGSRGCPDCDTLHLIVADASRKGVFLLLHVSDAYGPDRPITPRLVREVVQAAVRGGWEPGVGADQPFSPTTSVRARLQEALDGGG
ncbi:MAG: hypothetical protein ACPG4T_09395 [Nannocystaceae bacterium]